MICQAALATDPKDTRELSLELMKAKGMDTGDKVLAKGLKCKLISSTSSCISVPCLSLGSATARVAFMPLFISAKCGSVTRLSISNAHLGLYLIAQSISGSRCNAISRVGSLADADLSDLTNFFRQRATNTNIIGHPGPTPVQCPMES